MLNVGNFLGNNLKTHLSSNRLDKRRTVRNKLFWGRSTASGSGCGVIRIKPKSAGQKLYIAVGNGGDNSNFPGVTWAYQTPTNVGHASGVGTLPDYSSNIFVAPQGDLQQVGKAGAEVGKGANAVGYSPGGFDTALWTNFQIISNPTPADGKTYNIYNSWNALASVPTVSTYDNTTTGPGASGYNDAAQNYASHPAIGGYVKVTIVE